MSFQEGIEGSKSPFVIDAMVLMLISWDKVRHGQRFVLSDTLIFSFVTIFAENHEYIIFSALRSRET